MKAKPELEKAQEPVTFKVEDSIWQVMAEGKKTFDARQYDLADERIRRLITFRWIDGVEGRRQPYWMPAETFICFKNKKTGDVLKCRYVGYVGNWLVDWAPGWVFFIFSGIGVNCEPIAIQGPVW